MGKWRPDPIVIMGGRYRFLRIAGMAVLPALWLSAGREACAQQINLSNTRTLDFGRFVAGTGGTVTVGPTGARSRTGGVILLTSPSAGVAEFAASRGNGGAGKAVSITLPANGSTRLTSGNSSMAVNTFVSSPATLTSIATTGTTLSIGATLTVAANQPPGSYSGSFPLIVNFQ
jgi:hypothetical protein